MRGYAMNTAKRQQGSALMIAIVLLLLAGLMSVLAMNVGMFEQRSSGNDLRAKIVKQVAEAGLSQGFEFLMRAHPEWLDDASKWRSTPCGASEETFPCGAVPATMRSSMFPLKAGGYTVSGLDTDLTKYMLEIPNPMTGTGIQDVAYGVAPLLCRVSLPISGTNVVCATGMSNLSDRRVVSFVSVAQLRGDSGRMTLTQTVSRSSLLAQGAGVPAVIASGNATPSGNGDVIAMPNAAGEGLDISIWSRLNVDISTATSTCDRYTIMTDQEKGKNPVSFSDPDWRTKVLGLGCPKKSTEGWDVLDHDSDAGGAGSNLDVKYSEFPCDLFEYAFNVKTWEDNSSPKDYFCETRLPKQAFEGPDGNTYQLYPDEIWLYTNAKKIIDANGGTRRALIRADQEGGSPLSANSAGLVWCRSGCDKIQVDQVGTPEKPVLLIIDGSTLNHAVIYGMVFMRDDSSGPLDANTGGSAAFKQNSNAGSVFGSVFIQGQFSTGSGNGLIWGDPEILLKISNDPSSAVFNTLRGGWTDRYSY